MNTETIKIEGTELDSQGHILGTHKAHYLSYRTEPVEIKVLAEEGERRYDEHTDDPYWSTYRVTVEILGHRYIVRQTQMERWEDNSRYNLVRD